MTIDDKGIAAELDSIASEAAQAEQAEKAAPGAPPKDQGTYVPGPAPVQPQRPRISTADAITGLLMVTFNLLAARRGAHWKLQPVEAEEAGQAYADVIDKYWPEFETGPELAAIGVTMVIVAPRALADSQLKQQTKEAADNGNKSEPDTKKQTSPRRRNQRQRQDNVDKAAS